MNRQIGHMVVMLVALSSWQHIIIGCSHTGCFRPSSTK